MLVTAPTVPVRVTVAVPGMAVLAAFKVKTLFELVVAGLNVPVTPAGRPEIDKKTEPPKLLGFSTLMVEVTPLPPTKALRVDAEDVRLKLGMGTVT